MLILFSHCKPWNNENYNNITGKIRMSESVLKRKTEIEIRRRAVKELETKERNR